MDLKFVPCDACDRHILTTEAVCPFCGAAAPETRGPGRLDLATSGRAITRAALLFAGATTVAACGSSSVVEYGPGPILDVDAGEGGASSGGPVALYGPAPVDAGPHLDATAPDAGQDASEPGEDSGGGVVLYGPGPVG